MKFINQKKGYSQEISIVACQKLQDAFRRKLKSMGFKFNLVLAEVECESGKNFIQVLNELNLKFIVAHGNITRRECLQEIEFNI